MTSQDVEMESQEETESSNKTEQIMVEFSSETGKKNTKMTFTT